jgi:hypothetical protein
MRLPLQMSRRHPLDVDWNRQAVWAAAAALLGASVGVVGCALILSSGLARRRYRTA